MRRAGPGISPHWHYHNEIEVDLIIAGRGTYFLDDAHYDLSPGVLVWMLPNQTHRLLPAPDLRMWTLTCASDHLERPLLDQVARHANRVIAREDAIALDRLFVHVSQDADEPMVHQSGVEYALRSALHISMSGPEPAQSPLHPAVSNALRVLRDVPDIANAAALAARCGVSAVYLRELLAEQTGRGFTEWRNRFRLGRFQIRYLESQDLLTAALDAGFGSYTQFHRVFLDIVGTTPGDWATGGSQTPGQPDIADFAPAPDRNSSRMTSYAIPKLSFDALSRWIAPGFSAALAAPAEAANAYHPLPSHVFGSYDLHRYRDELLDELEVRDALAARHLRIILSRFDVFASQANALSHWGVGLDDLALLLGSHIYASLFIIDTHAMPSPAAVPAFAHRVAAALEASGSFSEAAPEDLRRATAAMCIKGFVLREALMAAYNSGVPERMAAVADACRGSLIDTFGLDPDHHHFLRDVGADAASSHDRVG